jgi:four helix bundle protein
MTPEDLKRRTTDFAIALVKFCAELRRKPEARNIADQLSAAATAVAANYRTACRARSHREFVSRIAVAVEEADETVGWLKIIAGAELAGETEIAPILAEAEQILAILAASRRTAQRNSEKR